jgi:hypothetical protein
MIVQARVSINRHGLTGGAAIGKSGVFAGILFGNLGDVPFLAGSWEYRIIRVWRILASQWLPPR